VIVVRVKDVAETHQESVACRHACRARVADWKVSEVLREYAVAKCQGVGA
jgi:hypothetical protein